MIDCLCYEASSDSDMSVVWAPNYFDKAFASCPAYVSTADMADYDNFESATGLCSECGDYYMVGTTDTSSYVIALATSSAVESLGTTATTTPITTTQSAAASTTTNTPGSPLQTGGARSQSQYIDPYLLLSIIPLIML